MSKCSMCGKETDITNLSNLNQDVEVICSLICLDAWKLKETLKKNTQFMTALAEGTKANAETEGISLGNFRQKYGL